MPAAAAPLPEGAGLYLCAIWLNVAVDPDDVCVFTKVGDGLSLTTDPRVEIRQLANRRRLIRRGVNAYESYALTLPGCTPEQGAWLRRNVGELLCIRDHVGTKFYGAYLTLPRELATWTRERVDVKLVVEQADFSEEV
ncbi:hypothetical protein [Nocardioides sp. SYSU DS0663]|uniref:hypothetical protein n=1 Tax=Nocardioides sp. SYSU DS0663 TaxID=3416445 RepID=UPI003F4C6207